MGMTYKKLYEDALFKLEHNKITLGKFEEMIKPLDREIEQEPTTKNCESCRYYGSYHEVCNYCYKCSLWTEKEPTTKNVLGVDCISRQATINAVKRIHPVDIDCDCTLYDRVDVMYVLNDLPSVTPQELRWIPVSEKLPNDRDWYLGIFKEPDTGWINPLPFICDYVGRETKATTKEHWILRGFTDMDEHIDYYFNLECVAWMPLPPSYQGE